MLLIIHSLLYMHCLKSFSVYFENIRYVFQLYNSFPHQKIWNISYMPPTLVELAMQQELLLATVL